VSEFEELLEGKSYQARSADISQPTFEALVNRDKEPSPFLGHPLMVNEALAAIPRPFRLDSLAVTNGFITYQERLIAGQPPGVLTFGDITLSVEGIANGSASSNAEVMLRGRTRFMNAGLLNVMMKIAQA